MELSKIFSERGDRNRSMVIRSTASSYRNYDVLTPFLGENVCRGTNHYSMGHNSRPQTIKWQHSCRSCRPPSSPSPSQKVFLFWDFCWLFKICDTGYLKELSCPCILRSPEYWRCLHCLTNKRSVLRHMLTRMTPCSVTCSEEWPCVRLTSSHMNP